MTESADGGAAPAPREATGEPGGTPGRAAPTGGLFSQLGAEQFSMQQVIGGPRGVLESVLPMTVFSAAYGFTSSGAGKDTAMRTSLTAAVLVSAAFIVLRVVRREQLSQAISGLIGIGLGAFIALRTGNASDIAWPSIIKNSAYGMVLAISVLVRWPLIGVVAGVVRQEGTHWRADRNLRKLYTLVTWIWVAVFGIRLAVQIPLYLAQQPALLGYANVALGLPLFGVAAWLSWLLLRRLPPAHHHLPFHHHDEDPAPERP